MKDKKILLVFIGIIYLFVAFMLLPSIQTVFESFSNDEGGYTLKWLEMFFSNPKYLRYVRDTFMLGIATVFVCGIIGFTLAFAFNFYDFKHKAFGKLVLMLPICVPSTLFVYSIVNIYGSEGLLGNFLQWILRTDEQLYSFTGFWPILLVHALSQYLNFYIMISYGLTKIDKSQMESSIILGASKWKVFKDSFFMPLLPSIAGAAGLTFIGAIASFAAPSMIGGRFVTMSVAMNTTRMSGNLNLSSVLSVASSILIVLVLVSVYFLTHKKTTELSVKSTPFDAIRFKNPIFHTGFNILIWLMMILLMTSIVFVVLFSVFPPKGINTFTMDNFTLQGYVDVWKFSDIIDSIVYTFAQAGIVSFFAVSIAFILSYISLRTNLKYRDISQIIAVYPTFISDVSLAIAVIVTFNVPRWFVFGQTLYGDLSLLIIIMVIMSLNLPYRNFYASIQKISIHLDEAAQMLGADTGYKIRTVIIPIVRPVFISNFLIIFITKVQEYNLNTLIGPIGKQNIAMIVRNMASIQDTSRSNLTWVLGTIVLFIVVILLMLYNYFTEKHEKILNQ